MQLMMYIDNDLIESVSLELGQLSRPGYLGQFKRILKMRHAALINETGCYPEFLVIDLKPAHAVSTTSCASCMGAALMATQ